MKSLMVHLRSLTLTATIISLAACSSVTPYQSSSVSSPVVTAPTGGGSMIVSAVQSIYITNQYSLNKRQKRLQSQAVYASLDADYGKVTHWYEQDAMGAVKAVHGYPNGVGFCRIVFSAITVKGTTRQFEETACKKHYEDSHWYFIKK